MKLIIIAGGGRRAGKTALARALAALLPDSRIVKVGHHPARPDRPADYFLIGTPFCDIRAAVGDPAFLIVESGAILDDPEESADLVIFLPDPDGRDKPGSDRRRARADLVRGEKVNAAAAEKLAGRLGLDMRRFGALLAEVGAAVATGPGPAAVRIVGKAESAFFLSRDGTWHHQGQPFENEKIIRFFHRAIRKDGQGEYYLYNRFGDQEENVYFEVEDTAYFVWGVRRDPGGGRFFALLNTGREAPLDLGTLEEDERGVMYCRIPEGDRARFNYRALEQLSSHAAAEGESLFIEVAGERIPLPSGSRSG